MTPLLQYVARFDGGGEIVGFGWGRLQGEWAVVLPVCRIPVSISPSGEQLALLTCDGEGQACPPFPAFSAPYVFSGESVVVDVDVVGFRPL